MAELDDWITPKGEVDDWITPDEPAAPRAAPSTVSVQLSPDRLARKAIVPLPQPRPASAPQADPWLAARAPVPFTDQAPPIGQIGQTGQIGQIGQSIDAAPPAPMAEFTPPLADISRFMPGYQPQQPGAPLTQGQPDLARGIAARVADNAGPELERSVLDLPPEQRKQYPRLAAALDFIKANPLVAGMDATLRLPGVAIGAGSGLVAGLAERFGLSPAEADRLQRDLNIIGQGAMIETGNAPHGALPETAVRSTRGQVEDFLGTAEGLRSRAEIDEFLRQKAASERPIPGQQELPSPEQATKPEPAPSAAPAANSAEPAPSPDNSRQFPTNSDNSRQIPTNSDKLGQTRTNVAEPPEAATLRAYGYTDEQIQSMTPAQRAAEVKDAIDAGVQPEEGTITSAPSNEGGKRDIATRAIDGEIIPPSKGGFDQVPWTAADGNPWGMSDQDYAVWKTLPENREAVENWNRDNKIIDHDDWISPPGSAPAESAPPAAPQSPSPSEDDGIKTVHVRKRKPSSGPHSLLQFIAARGGIDPNDPLIADVRQVIGGKNKLIPGYGPLIRKGGKLLDNHREAAVDSGYLRDTPYAGGVQKTTPNDIIQLIDEDSRGRKTYPEGSELTQEDQKNKLRYQAGEDQLAQHREDVRAAVAEYGITEPDEKHLDKAARFVAIDGMDPVDAYDAAVMHGSVEDGFVSPEEIDSIYGDGAFDAVQPPTAPQDGATPAREGHEVAEGEGGHGGDGNVGSDVARGELVPGTRENEPTAEQVSRNEGAARSDGAAEGTGGRTVDSEGQRADEHPAGRDEDTGRPAEGLTEATPAGAQHVLPGAEKAPDKDLAQIKSDRPLKPKAEQKPMDVGMFGDEAAQTDLVDMANKPEPAKGGWKEIGQNADGETLFEDKNGVRSRLNGAVRISEPVKIVPKRGGGFDYEVGQRDREWHTVAEHAPTWAQVLYALPKDAKGNYDLDLAGRLMHELGGKKAYKDLTDEQKIEMLRRLQEPAKQPVQLPEGFKVRARKQTSGGETYSLYQKGKGYVGTFPTEAEAIAAARAPAKATPATGSLADRFAEHFAEGKGFNNILQARRFAKDAGFEGDAKAVEEMLELAVVKAAREIATKPDAFKELVALYGHQPRLSTRTSTSVRDQAYSTPVPLAYVASRLAGITSKTKVFEPTAGNGALLIEANPKNAVANELNPERRQNLTDQGFNVLSGDASDGDTKSRAVRENGGQQFDVVVANPPFGPVKEGTGSKTFDMGAIQPGYRTHEIDHAIALKSLVAMRDDGRAVLILGGLNKLSATREARSDGYNGKAKREFYKTLYDRYNVTDHFTVAGELYERQGAGWPVDVIVIDGRGKSALRLPAVDVPRVYRSWDELGGVLDAARGNEGIVDRPADGAPSAGTEAAVGNGGVRSPSGEDRIPDTQPGSQLAGSVQPGPDRGNAGNGRPSIGAGIRPANGGERGGSSPAPTPERRPSGLEDFDDAFDSALDDIFGKPEAAPAPAPRAPDARPTKQVAKSAVTNAAQSADDAMAALVQMFGGGKSIGAGPAFDNETYAKAKPLFEKAASKFAQFAHDVRELVRRMVEEMQRIHGLTREALVKLKPYLHRFMEDLQTGEIKLGEKEQPKAKPLAAKAEQETERQVSYQPASTQSGLGTLVPVNMRTSIEESLKSLESRVGNLDTYVANHLGYTDDELSDAFAAEQVDALALAIDNLQKGKGFIIGDQTGIGKGRVNAGIIRWAIKNKSIPIFVTEDPKLYGDMYRDLSDIGIQKLLGHEPRILPTNTNLKLDLTEDGSQRLNTGTKHNAVLSALRPGNFREDYDMVFTNYSQMQTVKSEDTARRRFLSDIAPGSVVIFDESHNAGGQSASRPDPKAPPNRAAFARELVDRAKGVFYSSATYAKRPDVMDLYSKTDMAMAVENKDDLGEAIASGGVPMQQAVAAMLAKAGQYIRRERSFAGVTYDTPTAAVDQTQYDDISTALSAIQDFSKAREGAVENINQTIKGDAQSVSFDGSTGGAGASSVNFTSIMHNVIGQMLLALKAEPAAKMAIDAIKRGEKPVLTVANTMESILNDYAESTGVEKGQTIDGDFSKVLNKYLERTRTLTIKKPFSKKGDSKKHYLTDAELGPVGRAAYAKAKRLIESLDLSALSLSPIDRLKSLIEKEGYKVGEITGRGTTIDYSGAQPTLQTRSGRERSINGRRETITKFNNGELDAVVLNQAGATGISLHASKNFKDQRQRHMIIAQAEANIDTHMQMLGRVHRTGQVIVPKYSQLIADIPAEKRPAAVLAKKMASLNASTTASRGGALTAENVVDFMNIYGDAVAAAYIADEPLMNKRLAFPLKLKESGGVEKEDAMRRVTGRIPLLPLKDQTALYEHLEAEYDALLKQMDAAGENALEAKTLDMQAKPLGSAEVVAAKGGSSSPFAAPVTMEKVSARRLGKPFPSDEVARRVAESLGLDPETVTKENAASRLDDWSKLPHNHQEEALKEFDVYKRRLLDDVEEGPAKEEARQYLDANAGRFAALADILNPGARVTLKTSNGNLTGVVLKLERKGKTKNPLALSGWKATVALANASRQITLPLSRLFEDGKSSSSDDFAVEVAPIQEWIENTKQTLDRFDNMQGETREERYIATGNLLRAYEWLNHKGRIVNYTDEAGAIRQGILTPQDFKFAEHAARKGRVMQGPEEVGDWLDKNVGIPLKSDDDAVTLTRQRNGLVNIAIQRAKQIGGKYYLDRTLTTLLGDFYSRSGVMQIAIDTHGVPTKKVLYSGIERLQKLGAKFTESVAAPTMKDGPISGPAASVARVETNLTPKALQRRADLEHMLTNLVHKIAGNRVRVRFSPGKSVDFDGPATGWGDFSANNVEGSYIPAERLIELALGNPRVMSTAFHEALHDIEAHLWSDRELDLMMRETDRLRDIVKRRFGFTDNQVAGIAGYEIRAMAFEAYAEERANGGGGAGYGLHIGIRRAFERLLGIFRAIRNGLSRLGFDTAESIFGKAYEGKFAERTSRNDAPIGLAEGPVASVRTVRPRSGNLPTPQIEMPHETVRAAMRDPTLSRTERLSAAFDALVLPASRALWDKMIDVARLQRAAELATGQDTAERFDTYLAATLYPGRAGERLLDASHDLFRPIYDAMKEHNVGRDELHDYLYARHAAERNEQIRKIDPQNDAGSGMTDDEARDILDAARPRQRDFNAVTERVDAVVAHNRDLMEREGLEHAETLMQWAEAYDHYVPLKGAEASESELQGTPSIGAGFDVRRGESRRALGRFSRSDDILTNLLDQAQRTIIRAEKNRVGKAFLRFVQKNPSPLYKIGLAEQRRIINPSTGLVDRVWVTTNADAANVFGVKIAGDTHYIKIEHDGLVTALKNVGMERLPWFGRMLSSFTRQYSAFQTARNPEFVLTNLMRDLQDAGFSLTAEQQKGFKRAFAKNLLNGRALMSAVLGEVGKTDNRFGRLYDEWRLSGGKISSFGYKGIETIRREIERELNQRTESMTRKILAQPLRTVNPFTGHVVKLFEAMSDVTESMTRLAVYAAARDVGLSKAQAGRASREMTVDFNKQGTAGPWLKALYAFSGPQIQGTVNLARRLRKSRKMRTAAAGIAGLGFALAMWNLWAAGDDDDDKKNNYAKKPYWEREKNIIFFMPGGKDAITIPMKIPLGYALTPFWMMGENAAMALMGKISPMEALSNWIGSAAQSFNPLGGEGSVFSLHKWVEMLSPTIVDPIQELARNKNWLDHNIHPDEMPWTKGKPRSEQSKITTAPLAVQVAEWMNRASGGNTFQKGAADLYPDDLEYAWNFALGGFGKFMLNNISMAQDKFAGVDTPIERIPFVRRFVSPVNSEAGEASQYYQASHEAGERTQAVRDAVKSERAGNNVEDAQKTIADYGDKVGYSIGPRGGVSSQADKIFREAGKQINKLRLEERDLRRDTTADRADRAEMIKHNRADQVEIMRDARRRYRELQPNP